MKKIIGVVGYGLIGGSFGMALKENTNNYIIAIDNSKEVLDYVEKNNLADEVSDVNCTTVKKCDIIYIALYPDAIIDFFKSFCSSFKKDAIIVDLCGIKHYIHENISTLDNINFHYIGAHPMAGKEKNGITAACSDLYNGASFLITKTEKMNPEALETVEQLAKSVGFKNIIVTDDINHDKMITYTSQLPHIMSVAYIMQESHDKCYGYYAGSFKDMTRVADINAGLWTQLFKHNKEILTTQIDEYINSLVNIRDYINSDGDELLELLNKSKLLKEWQDENYTY